MSAETWRLAKGKSPVRLCAKVGDEAHTIARVYLTDANTRKRTPEALARAHKIEAAAEMYAALKWLISVDLLPQHNPQYPPFVKLEACPPGHAYECGNCEARRTILAAVAKAEGREP